MQRILKHGQGPNKGRTTLLRGDEFEVIYRYVESQAWEGFEADLDMIGQRIRMLIQLRKPGYKGPSESFLQRFTHSEQFKSRLKAITSKPIDHKRKTAQDVTELRKWMRQYKKVL